MEPERNETRRSADNGAGIRAPQSCRMAGRQELELSGEATRVPWRPAAGDRASMAGPCDTLAALGSPESLALGRDHRIDGKRGDLRRDVVGGAALLLIVQEDRLVPPAAAWRDQRLIEGVPTRPERRPLRGLDVPRRADVVGGDVAGRHVHTAAVALAALGGVLLHEDGAVDGQGHRVPRPGDRDLPVGMRYVLAVGDFLYLGRDTEEGPSRGGVRRGEDGGEPRGQVVGQFVRLQVVTVGRVLAKGQREAHLPRYGSRPKLELYRRLLPQPQYPERSFELVRFYAR